MCEHLGISVFTEKRVKGDDDSAITSLFWNHPPVFEYFPIFTINNNEFKVILIESVLINRNNPHLNKKKQPLTLERFDSRGSMFHYMIRRETDSPCCSWVVL